MKAMHIMMFLLIFNLSISIISATNIYNMDYEQEGDLVDEFENQTVTEEQANDISTRALMRFFMAQAGVFGFALVSGTIAGISDKYFGTGISGLDAFLYALFTGLFVTTTWKSSTVFLSIGRNNFGVILVVIAFLLICGVVFTIGIYQIASKGGWRSFE